MSAGPFEEGKYESDDGKIWRCKVQPETKGLNIGGSGNAYPAEAATAGLPRLKLSTSRRQQGIRPRYVMVTLTADGSGETAQYKAGTKHKVVIFQKDGYDLLELQETGTYLGIACRLDFKSGEASS